MTFWKRSIPPTSEGLWAFYDLAASPSSFEFTTFLYTAELRRRQKGHPALHVVIVPGFKNGFRTSDSKEQNGQGTENLRWRLRNIVLPCAWLLPSCRQLVVCGSREEAKAIQTRLAGSVFPKGYLVDRPKKQPHLIRYLVQALQEGGQPPTFEATPLGLFHVGRWIQARAGSRKLITIVLRESTYHASRNSNIHAWAEFAEGLDPEEFCPVFVRDTEAALDPVPAEIQDFEIFQEACWNVELRAALYELSYVVLYANSGAGALCTYNRRVRYIEFKMLDPSCNSTKPEYFEGPLVGVPVGSERWPWSSPLQKLVWEDDNLEVIQREFQKMYEEIKQNPYAAGGAPAGFLEKGNK
ncbi:MAG: hypothetical protein HYZ52_04300 [Candidatus Omnitrophica bacterium]|nr:hypothetical protein [Candidatus Omnitrophota bacterium]